MARKSDSKNTDSNNSAASGAGFVERLKSHWVVSLLSITAAGLTAAIGLYKGFQELFPPKETAAATPPLNITIGFTSEKTKTVEVTVSANLSLCFNVTNEEMFKSKYASPAKAESIIQSNVRFFLKEMINETVNANESTLTRALEKAIRDHATKTYTSDGLKLVDLKSEIDVKDTRLKGSDIPSKIIPKAAIPK
jgi:hypothetical protein